MATSAAALVPVSETDYLEEDKSIRGQNFVCLSFISPENVLKNKEAFYVERFISKLSVELGQLFSNLKAKYPEEVSAIDGIADNHSQFLKSDELQEYYKYFKNANQIDIEKAFHEQNNFQTSVRGIKVRGVYDTDREAKLRAEKLKKEGDKHSIYIAQVGCWCPWDPSPEAITDQEYSTTQLNTLMKEYNENQDKRDVFFEERKRDKIADAKSRAVGSTPAITEIPEGEENVVVAAPITLPEAEGAPTE